MAMEKDSESLRSSVLDVEKLEDDLQYNSSDANLTGIDPVVEKRAVWKVDVCILPLMTLFYLLSFLDRANIGNARVAGLQADLGLSDWQYQVAITCLYVFYIASELPSNLLLRKIGPHILMPSIMTIWGIICTLQGTVTTFQGLATVRAFLGLVEGPMFPGIVLYLSGFYKRSELNLRIALFFSAASLSGAFSGLLAAAIENLDGVGGKPGWAWIFILEGLFTVVVGVVGFFIVPSAPQNIPWLTQAEREIVERRLSFERPSIRSEDTFRFNEVWKCISSPHVILVCIANFMDGATLFGLALFLPSIVNALGYSPTTTQLISVGPYAAAFVVTICSAYLSDRYRYRGLSTIAACLIALPGFVIFLLTSNPHIAYGSLFLSVSGVYAKPTTLSAWMANNNEPHYRRATGIAMGFISANCGGIMSTWLYPKAEGPRFHRATIVNLCCIIGIIVVSIINILYLRWANRQKRIHRAELLAPYAEEGRSDGGDRAWKELGDRHPDFVYSY